MKRIVIALLAPIAVATALIVLTMPAHAQSTYTWAVTCTGDSASEVGTGFTWNWTLASGTTMPGGFAACLPPYNSGTGTIPPTTTAITVYATIASFGTNCEAFKTVTQSVSPSESLSVNIHISLPSSANSSFGKEKCTSGGADLKLGN